jgi:NADP-dependent 3-hydroxy acid dehydrogenase YdfG
MENLKSKFTFITGASSGIGKSTAYAFAKEGADLIISARRFDRIEVIADDISEKYGVNVLPLELDITQRDKVQKIVNTLPEQFAKIDILVNNAGLGRGLNKIYEDDPKGWDEMIDTNIKGLLNVTRYVVPGMVKRGSGHVINIGSIAGHQAYGGGAVYCATKHSVKAITESMRIDLLDKGVRVSTVDPGMVETEFSIIRFYGDEEKAKSVYNGLTPLTGDDIADAVLFCATRAPHANINEIIIMPSVQANAFVTYRK